MNFNARNGIPVSEMSASLKTIIQEKAIRDDLILLMLTLPLLLRISVCISTFSVWQSNVKQMTREGIETLQVISVWPVSR